MSEKKKKKMMSAFQMGAIIGMLILILYIIVRFLPEAIQLLKSGSEKEMEEYISHVGRRGVLIIVVLQFLQTITIVFPGIPIYMVSGIVYGKIYGTLLCYMTYVMSNCIVFCASKKMGEAKEELFDLKNQRGIAELVNKTKSPAKLIGCLCVLPVIPNGIIPHIAARSGMELKKFIPAVAIGCIPGIFLFVCCGELLASGNYAVIMALIVVSSICALIFFVFKNKLMKWMNGKFSNK